jgi:hypothetical protein
LDSTYWIFYSKINLSIFALILIKLARYILPEPKEAPVSSVKEDYPLFVDTREDALRLLRMTEDGPEQVGGSIEFV